MSRQRAGWLLFAAGLLVAAAAFLVGLQRDDENAAVDIRNAQVRDLVDGFDGRQGDDEERTRAKWAARESREFSIALVVAGVGLVIAAAGVVVVATTGRRDTLPNHEE